MTEPHTAGPADVAQALRDGVPPSSLVGEAPASATDDGGGLEAESTDEAGGFAVRTTGSSLLAARDRALAGLDDDLVPRLVQKDPTLWGPEASGLASVRLGWLDVVDAGRELLTELMPLVQQLHDEGLHRVLVLCADGSASGTTAVCSVDATPDAAEVIVLDDLDPVRVRGLLTDLDRTVVVACSRTGLDLDDHLAVVGAAFETAGLDLSERLLLVTDPGSSLAAQRSALAVLPASADVDGAFSALTAVGLVPAALGGVDVVELLDEVDALLATLDAPSVHPAVRLGAALGGAAASGRRTVVLVDAGTGRLGPWAAQLVAEVSGGSLVVVEAETLDSPGTEPAADTQLVLLGNGADDGAADATVPRTTVTGSTGAQMIGWQVAATVAAAVLGTNPFARTPPGGPASGSVEPEGPPQLVQGQVQVRGQLADGTESVVDAIDRLLAAVPDRGYLAIMAHLDPQSDARAGELRALLAARLAHPVRLTWGSTGLLGDHLAGAFLQLTGAANDDVPVPGGDRTLGGRQAHVAGADRAALSGRPLLHLHLTDRASGLDTLLEAVRA